MLVTLNKQLPGSNIGALDYVEVLRVGPGQLADVITLV